MPVRLLFHAVAVRFSYCCIYLACKAEEHHLPVDRMIGIITNQTAKPATAAAAAAAAAAPVQPAGGAPRPSASATSSALSGAVGTVLSLEVPVLTLLKFHLRIYHIARSLRGLLKELETMDTATCALALYINADEPVMTQKLAQQQPAAGTTLQSVSSFLAGPRAQHLSQLALLSDDLIFLHSPAQIALAVLLKMQEEARQFGVEANLDTSANAAVSGAAASAAPSLRTLDLIERFVATKANTAPVNVPANASAAVRQREQAANLKRMQQRLQDILRMLEEARVQSSQ